MGYADLPIAVIPHPFGIRTRDEVRALAAECVDNIANLLCQPRKSTAGTARAPDSTRAELIEAPDDLMELNQLFINNRWSDGLPLIPPTDARVEAMLAATPYAPDHVVVQRMAPKGNPATVEVIAINAVMAGCAPEHLPLLIAPDGSKLSKRRHGPVVSVMTYRDAGFLPHAFVNFLCLLGWSPKNDREQMTRQELIEAFSFEGINRSNTMVRPAYSSGASPNSCRPCKHRL